MDGWDNRMDGVKGETVFAEGAAIARGVEGPADSKHVGRWDTLGIVDSHLDTRHRRDVGWVEGRERNLLAGRLHPRKPDMSMQRRCQVRGDSLDTLFFINILKILRRNVFELWCDCDDVFTWNGFADVDSRQLSGESNLQ